MIGRGGGYKEGNREGGDVQKTIIATYLCIHPISSNQSRTDQHQTFNFSQYQTKKLRYIFK